MKRPAEQPGEDIRWRRSSRCSAGTCVEVGVDEANVWVRNSQQPETAVLLSASEWTAFVAGVKDGEFD
jgi:hypothetical protein